MKKEYISPKLEISVLAVQSLLEQTSIGVGDPLTEGNYEGSSKNYYDVWENDSEE